MKANLLFHKKHIHVHMYINFARFIMKVSYWLHCFIIRNGFCHGWSYWKSNWGLQAKRDLEQYIIGVFHRYIIFFSHITCFSCTCSYWLVQFTESMNIYIYCKYLAKLSVKCPFARKLGVQLNNWLYLRKKIVWPTLEIHLHLTTCSTSFFG